MVVKDWGVSTVRSAIPAPPPAPAAPPPPAPAAGPAAPDRRPSALRAASLSRIFRMASAARRRWRSSTSLRADRSRAGMRRRIAQLGQGFEDAGADGVDGIVQVALQDLPDLLRPPRILAGPAGEGLQGVVPAVGRGAPAGEADRLVERLAGVELRQGRERRLLDHVADGSAGRAPGAAPARSGCGSR